MSFEINMPSVIDIWWSGAAFGVVFPPYCFIWFSLSQMPIREACHVAVQRHQPSKHRLWKHALARQEAKGQSSTPVLQIVCISIENQYFFKSFLRQEVGFLCSSLGIWRKRVSIDVVSPEQNLNLVRTFQPSGCLPCQGIVCNRSRMVQSWAIVVLLLTWIYLILWTEIIQCHMRKQKYIFHKIRLKSRLPSWFNLFVSVML